MPLDFSQVVITVPLVPLDEAKQHLHVTGTDRDADITAIRDDAQDAILAYLGAAADATWTDATVPPKVRNAIKYLMAHFDRYRGDDDVTPDPWKHLANLLAFARDPALG